MSAAVQEKKDKARFTFIEQFAQRLDRAIQGHNDRDAQVVYAAKPLLQYITLRIQDYLDPRTAEPLSGEDGGLLWDPAELKVPDWLYTERGEAIAEERRARLAAVLPKARDAAVGFPGEHCPDLRAAPPVDDSPRASPPTARSARATCSGNGPGCVSRWRSPSAARCVPSRHPPRIEGGGGTGRPRPIVDA